MAQGQNKQALKINLIQFIPGLVLFAEHAFGRGSGDQKKAQVQSDLQGLESALVSLGFQMIGANNPAYGSLINTVAAGMFPPGTTVSTPGPTPISDPAPPVSTPTPTPTPVPSAPPTSGAPPAPVLFSNYGVPINSLPDDSTLTNGDRIYGSPNAQSPVAWWIGYAFLPGQQPDTGSGFVYIRTITK